MTASAGEQTETTPLLNSTSPNRHSTQSTSTDIPFILPYVDRFLIQGLPSDDHWYPEGLSEGAERAAFQLLLLLVYKVTLKTKTHANNDDWEQWSEEAKHAASVLEVETRIVETWETFLNVPRSPAEVEQVLWKVNRLSEGPASLIRVIDLFEYFPPTVLCHRVVELSLLRTWRSDVQGGSRDGSTWVHLAKLIYAPRWLHLLDLLGLVAYLGILARYALDPPGVTTQVVSGLDVARTVTIVLYCLTRILQGWTLTQAPYFIVALAFLSSLPSTPLPNDISYDGILIALSLHILQLHLPYPPSPLHLFPFRQVLPLSLLIWNGVAKIYLPVLALFLPALLLVLVLLSLSLTDAIVTATTVASPLEARTAFVLLLLILLFLLIFSVGMLILVYPFISANTPPSSPWDKYSIPLGLEARRAFVLTVVAYAVLPSTISRPLKITTPSTDRRLSVWVNIRGLHRMLRWMTVVPLPFLLVGILVWDILA